MNDSIKKLWLKMVISRMTTVLFLNLVLGALVFKNIRYKEWINITLILADVYSIFFLLRQRRRIAVALSLNKIITDVELRSVVVGFHPSWAQIYAYITFPDEPSHKKRFVIDMSTISPENSSFKEPFKAEVYIKENDPKLIVGLELEVLATVGQRWEEP